MDVAEHLTRLGGVSTRAALLERCSRSNLAAAIRSGVVVRVGRGRYALAGADEAVAAAHALAGTLCLASAALQWGWSVKLPPDQPQVALARNRKIDPARAAAVDLHRFDLDADDAVDGITSRDRTLLDCLRHLPFDEALAITDSALRDGFSRDRLIALTRDARGAGAARMRHLSSLATPLAANPFESTLRAIALRVDGLNMSPQVSIRSVSSGGTTFLGRVDLADETLGIILEADSFEWHGHRDALRNDARRYNSFAVNGWLVLRFSWEDVMFGAEGVAAVLGAAVRERRRTSA